MIKLFGIIVCVVAILAVAGILQTHLRERSKRTAKLKEISQRLEKIEAKGIEDKEG